MNISYNGMYDPESNILTFTDVPNILKIEEYISGEKADITLTFDGNIRQTVTADSQYYITILGETITNVMNPQNANNKRFYCSGDEDGTAMSVCRALRNCSSLAADFNIIHNGNEVAMIAKTIGKKNLNTPGAIQNNLPNANFTIEVGEGNAYSVLWNSKIDIDVYSGSTTDNDNYVTTLEKNYYGDECGFDMSPVLATISEYGRTKPYQFNMHLITEDGEWQHLGVVSGNTTIGYLANQSYKYYPLQGAHFAINTNRPMLWYTYGKTIEYSVLCGPDTGGWSEILSCKDSAGNEIYNSGTQTRHRTSSNYLIDEAIEIPDVIYTSTYYADLTVGTQTIRFNVIKPLKATEYSQRIYWRNEYGGISFFDFTGQRTETDSVNTSTYEKNIFDYYVVDNFELKKVYDKSVDKKVTLTSHLMEEGGKYQFNSLDRSKSVWTYINGKKHYIIIENVEVTEDQNYNGIYVAKITYSYSDLS